MNLTTLEQSKCLKSVGAPQDTYFGWDELPSGKSILVHRVYWNKDSQISALNRGEMINVTKDPIAAYDLESLIEWMGKDFMKLVHQGDGSWAIWGDDGTSYCCYETPLEAVYALAEYMHLTTKV